ncbi:MAG: helix-turn-helix domain-containing protein, partial [Betaproteobacteria bacterium]|nr:helix-turn-helix domain-containing protein [Betaproteobacteria bacterium]
MNTLLKVLPTTLPTTSVTEAMPSNPTAYAQIEVALRFLAEHSSEQPSLAEVAQATGLSEFHLHRQFLAWAGLTPKEFLQYLTAERAKQLLAESRSVLDTSLSVGLSGPSRLHDLMLDIDSLTPGEYKQQARGIDIDWALADTPFGTAVFAATRRGLCLISFVDNVADAEAELATRWP